MTQPLLIEIGVEELPAIPFLKELPNIRQKWHSILNAYHLDSDFTFYYTPRRLVFIHKNFLTKQPDAKEMFYGAPVEIAFKDGQPTPAAIGFAKKCGVDISAVSRSEKNGKEVLYYEKTVPGSSAEILLGEMIDKFLESLHFGKAMRWGTNTKSFIRPVRWMVCMLGNHNVSCEIFGVDTAMQTYVHRTHSYAPQSFSSIESYEKLLDDNSVILDPVIRKERILAQFDAIEEKNNITIETDEALLEEVVAITEYPNALLGGFDTSFLQLPPEVIITSMKEHQRYFPVFKEGALSNHFIVVSNAKCDDYSQVISGNEKVLRPRLSDALFFYENDIKNGLSPEGLKNITFMEGLGSIYEKSEREEKIAQYLRQKYALAQDSELLTKTVMLAKADLLTDMVYEFTELQGVMGYYYAKAAGEDEDLAIALKEQYLPDGEESQLPSTDFSAVVALCNKIDTILSLFSIGKIPTGTKDPFGLRRSVVGIIKIVQDRGFAFDIQKDLFALVESYKNVDRKKLEDFIIDRLLHHFDANASVIQAVLQTGERDINEITKKVDALNHIVASDEFKEIATTFKRVANIVKDVDLQSDISVNPALLSEKDEKELYTVFETVMAHTYGSYQQKLEALFGLKAHIDSFFDHVMVNVEDEKIKNNRKNLIASIYKAFREIAEIKLVTV